MGFKEIRKSFNKELNMTTTIYEHEKTGAKHVHVDYNTTQNFFNVTFNTLPKSSNGVAHILEHSVLNGSKKYPIHGMFFAMQGRNFETYSNALTGFTLTEYPFSTIDVKGYSNLMSVYTDAVFFPTLDKEIFLQEGWRYTFEEPNNPYSKLSYGGVVFNEMIGAYNNSDRVGLINLIQTVFKNTQYENFSGGDPLDIPSLSYEEFKNFHETYYHPSNATFYTFGSINAKDIQEQLEKDVLSKFDRKEINTVIDTTQLNISGQDYDSIHPGENGVEYIKGFQLPKITSIEELFTLEILNTFILSGKNNIYDYFLKNTNEIMVEHAGMLPVKECVFYFALKMDEVKKEEANRLLKNYLEYFKSNKISPAEIDDIFEKMEMSLREGEASSSNLGKDIIAKYINANEYGFKNIEDIFNVDKMKSVKEKLKDSNYINQLIDSCFVHNSKYFSMTSVASPEYGAKMLEKLQIQLAEKEATITEEERLNIYNDNLKLEKLRLKEKDLSILPKLDLNDITITLPSYLDYKEEKVGNFSLYNFNSNTKDLSYIDIKFPIILENNEELFKATLVMDLMKVLSLNNLTLEETNLWRSSKIGHLTPSLSIRADGVNGIKGFYEIKSQALSENTEEMTMKALDLTTQISFEDKEIISNNILSLWREHISSYQENALPFIIAEAHAPFSEVFGIKKLLSHDYKMTYIKKIVENIEAGDFSFIEDLKSMYEKMFKTNALVFFCADEKYNKNVVKCLRKYDYNKEKFEQKINLTTSANEKTALDLNISINHLAYSISLKGISEEEEAIAKLFSSYIRPYLLTNIREKGGAYGANSLYVDEVLTFYTSRDPNPQHSLSTFKSVLNYFLNHEFDENQLKIDKLNILKQYNVPEEYINKAVKTVNKMLKTSPKDENKYISKILSTTGNEIKEFISKALLNAPVAVALASNSETIYENFSDWTINSLVDSKPTNKLKIK